MLELKFLNSVDKKLNYLCGSIFLELKKSISSRNISMNACYGRYIIIIINFVLEIMIYFFIHKKKIMFWLHKWR